MSNEEQGQNDEKATPSPLPKKKAKRATPPPRKPWKVAGFAFDRKKKEKDFLREEEDLQRAEDVEKGLEAIYLTDGDDDLGKIKHKKRRLWVKLTVGFFVLLGLLSAAVWVGFYFIDPQASDLGGGLAIQIEGVNDITLGKQETLVVHWKNQSRQPLNDVNIRLSFPAEFTPTDIMPIATDEENHIWKLGMLSPDETGDITIMGVFLGRLGDQAAVQALGTYQPNDGQDHAEFVTSFPLTYAQTILETTFVLPPKLVSGELFSLQYVIHNNSDDDLSNIDVHYVLPINFLPSTSGTTMTSIDSQPQTWTSPVALLAAHSTTTVEVQGLFGAGTSGDHTFKASIGRETELGDFLAITETEATVPVLSGDLGLQFVVNGSNEDRAIQPGDHLRLAVGYENLSPEILSDIELRVRIETLLNGEPAAEDFISWSDLEDQTSGVSSTEEAVHSLVYTKDALPVLGEMSPHQSGSIDIGVPTLPAKKTAQDVTIQLSMEGFIKKVGEDEVNRVVKTKSINLQYRTDADISAEARYFLEEGAPIGTGPLPPVAGETTRYRVYWVLNKQIHSLSDMRVEATLPNIAAWADHVLTDAGTIQYDETERKVVWDLNKVPQDVQRLEAWFDIDITPSDVDIGRFASLLGESHFTATDVEIGESIGTSKPPISTDLQNDEGARGKGVVRAKSL